MTSQTPGSCSIHWATRTHGEEGHLTENILEKRPLLKTWKNSKYSLWYISVWNIWLAGCNLPHWNFLTSNSWRFSLDSLTYKTFYKTEILIWVIWEVSGYVISWFLAIIGDVIDKTYTWPAAETVLGTVTCVLQIYSTVAGTSKHQITALRTLRGLNLKNLSVFSLIQPNFSMAGSFCKTRICQRFILKFTFFSPNASWTSFLSRIKLII